MLVSLYLASENQQCLNYSPGCYSVYLNKDSKAKHHHLFTGLISSHKQAASGTLGLRDKKKAIQLHNPSPGLSAVSQSLPWLAAQKHQKCWSPSQPSGALNPPLKGAGSHFSVVYFSLSQLCGSFQSTVKPVIQSDATRTCFRRFSG